MCITLYSVWKSVRYGIMILYFMSYTVYNNVLSTQFIYAMSFPEFSIWHFVVLMFWLPYCSLHQSMHSGGGSFTYIASCISWPLWDLTIIIFMVAGYTCPLFYKCFPTVWDVCTLVPIQKLFFHRQLMQNASLICKMSTLLAPPTLMLHHIWCMVLFSPGVFRYSKFFWFSSSGSCMISIYTGSYSFPSHNYNEPTYIVEDQHILL